MQERQREVWKDYSPPDDGETTCDKPEQGLDKKKWHNMSQCRFVPEGEQDTGPPPQYSEPQKDGKKDESKEKPKDDKSKDPPKKEDFKDEKTKEKPKEGDSKDDKPKEKPKEGDSKDDKSKDPPPKTSTTPKPEPKMKATFNIGLMTRCAKKDKDCTTLWSVFASPSDHPLRPLQRPPRLRSPRTRQGRSRPP